METRTTGPVRDVASRPRAVRRGQDDVKYDLGYRLGFAPWERYRWAAAASIAALLHQEETERHHLLGRAIDLGCGRAEYTPELARRGWEVVGVDSSPRAIDAANRKRVPGATFVVGDVTELSADLGMFDFFFDVGCFQGLSPEQRLAEGRAVTAHANPHATMLLLAFGVTRMRFLVGGVAAADVEAAFPGWQKLSSQPAQTKGLGWPLTRTSPRWYRLRRKV
jgi:SAM-dependent methyltransferase